MYFTQKIAKLKKISIIPILIATVPFAFIYLFLRDIPFLRSLFIDYVDSGNSLFFPFLSSTTIVFQFTTGHLIDILIVGNIIAFLERGGYHYVNVCLKRNYLVVYSESNYLDFNIPQEEPSVNSELPLCLKRESNPIVNDESSDNFYTIFKKFFEHGCYHDLVKKKSKSSYLRNRFLLIKKYYSLYRYHLTKNIKYYRLPSIHYRIFSFSSKSILKVEGS
jgi:hypothetical protein